MSADLWREFGNGAEDLLENPWAQSSSSSPNGESSTQAQFRDNSGHQSHGVLPAQVVSGKSADVLFDAEEDDDFGNFEHPLTPPSMGSLDPDLAKFNIPHCALNPRAPKSAIPEPVLEPVVDDANPFADLESLGKSSLQGSREQPYSPTQAHLSPHINATSQDTLITDIDFGDEWGDFINDSVEPINQPEAQDNVQLKQAVENSAPARIYSPRQSPLGVDPESKWGTPSGPKTLSGTLSKEEAPPNNVPPPSILLTSTTLLLSTLNSDLMHSIAETPPGPSLGRQVNLRLCVPITAARVIAGRKVRWKRDLNLSQSMKIGPASSGKTGGMKLAGIDNSKSLREDREVAEVIRLWKISVGPLRSIITKINQQKSGRSLTIPDISEIMAVRTAKPSEGAITAPKSCFLCGLKREERVNTVDGNVEDSFGEWWSDHWGHLTCRIFWEQYSDRLKRR